MRAWWITVLLLAGCADGSPPEVEEDLGLDTRATETTGVIRGVVVDEAVVPVEGVVVTIAAAGLQTTSNEDGAFAFQDLEPGLHFLEASRDGFEAVQTSVEVVAGIDRPDVVRLMLVRAPGTQPFIDPLYMRGFLACGVAVFYTSVGCTTYGAIASLTQSEAIWSMDFERLPMWSQGELVWTSTQALSGNFIWQIVQSEYPGSPQPHIGHMETTSSPALTYINTTVIEEYAEWILDKGIDYRFFGGPHELCPAGAPDPSVNRFGCGVTLQQSVDVYVHHFYNFAPQDGWRFTGEGDHPLPP